MNWPVIGLLIVFIFVLFGSLSVAAYFIIRLIDNVNRLMRYLNYYRELSNRYGLQLTRIGEGIEEFENEYSKDLKDLNVNHFVYNIKSLVKIEGGKK